MSRGGQGEGAENRRCNRTRLHCRAWLLVIGLLRIMKRSTQPMEECGENRPQPEQAEVQECGPHSSIVLAVLEIERKGECSVGGAFTFWRGFGGQSWDEARDAAAVDVEAGEGGAQKLFFPCDDRDVDDGEARGED